MKYRQLVFIAFSPLKSNWPLIPLWILPTGSFVTHWEDHAKWWWQCPPSRSKYGMLPVASGVQGGGGSAYTHVPQQCGVLWPFLLLALPEFDSPPFPRGNQVPWRILLFQFARAHLWGLQFETLVAMPKMSLICKFSFFKDNTSSSLLDFSQSQPGNDRMEFKSRSKALILTLLRMPTLL